MSAELSKIEINQAMDTPNAAKFLGFSVRALEGWRRKGEGPAFIKVSSRGVRYRIRDLLTFMDDRVAKSTSDFKSHRQSKESK